MKLEGKVALVTGSGRGIGRGIAEVMAEEGADVIVNDISDSAESQETAKLVCARGRRSMFIQADVSKREDVQAMFSEAWEQMGPIDILVNNAGIETIIPFLELTDEQWTRLVDVNLRGPWLCSQVFCQRVVTEKRQASIVHIGSIQAAKALPGRTHYAPAKLGLEALTRNMSAEMTPLGVRVNCVHPGYIETDMTRWIRNLPGAREAVLGQISMGRSGEPRDIGKVVAFFASDDAGYVTGQSLFVDGGWEGK